MFPPGVQCVIPLVVDIIEVGQRLYVFIFFNVSLVEFSRL